MKHIMLDLETLDTAPTGLIIAIGAVEFDVNQGLGREFYEVVDLNGFIHRSLTISPGTVKFWLGQTLEARAPFINKEQLVFPLIEVLSHFNYWVQSIRGEGSPVAKLNMWGNGSDFDNVLLRNHYTVYGCKVPWFYHESRCFRTLKNLGLPQPPFDPEDFGEKHNALADAKYQAACAIHYLSFLSQS